MTRSPVTGTQPKTPAGTRTTGRTDGPGSWALHTTGTAPAGYRNRRKTDRRPPGTRRTADTSPPDIYTPARRTRPRHSLRTPARQPACHPSRRFLVAVPVRQLPRRVVLLAGDLGERREGLGIGVVVQHVLAGPLRAVGVPAGLDHLGGCRRVVARTAQPDTW